MIKHFKFLVVILSLGLCVWAQDRTRSTSSEVSITAAEPTHYYYIPTANVNPPNCLVVSLHEMSYSFPDNLQVQASILDNIGRIVFGAKYGFHDNLSLGVGLANTLAHVGPGGHGINGNSRLGAYLCYGFVKNPNFEAVVTPHMQIFNGNALGCDIGGLVTPSPFWSVIWEVGTSIDVTKSNFLFNTDGGIRVHPPSIPFMNFDAGIDVSEFVLTRNPSTTPSIYFDAIFSMVTR